MEPRLRRASLDDLDELLALINDPASPHRQEACRHREEPEKASELYNRLNEDENLVFELDGRLVAYASWQCFDRHAHLNILAVAGSCQRQGLGRRMFHAFKTRARGDGMESYTLRAFADSLWAIRFYEDQGLQPLTPLEELSPAHPGLARYVALAMAHGQWPVEGKVVYFETLS
jgi:GNAT superfamily N-acetyltransferase